MTNGTIAEERRHRGRAVHREGRRLIWFCGAALLLAIVMVRKYRGPRATRPLLIAALAGLGFLVQFFRHPGCNTPVAVDLVVAPASGRVVHVGLENELEMFGDQRRRLSIFLSVFDAHLTRSPITGRVLDQRYHAGRYLVALHPKSSTLNERNSILLQHPDGTRLLVRQIAGFLARRIRSYVQVGSSVSVGEEVGFIKLGSRVDLFLPVSATVLVYVGQSVRAGETPVARLVNSFSGPDEVGSRV